MQALRSRGIDARMVVFTKLTDSPHVDVVSTRFRRLMSFGVERQRIFLHNGFSMKNAFHISDGSSGFKLWKHPWVKDADIIHMGWINQGLLSLKGLEKISELGKPLLWTSYDTWPFTGICHRHRGCDRYKQECGCCPYLKSDNPKDLSHRVWLKKKKVYEKSNIHFFTINEWMASIARGSSLLQGSPVHVLPPALDLKNFTTSPTEGYPSFDPIKNRRRILVKTPLIDDEPESMKLIIDSLNTIFDAHPQIANHTGVIFTGQFINKSHLDRLRFPWIYMGMVTDKRLLRQIYASCDVVLSTKKDELVGRSIIEGWAAGCMPVSIGGGAEKYLIDRPGENGFIAEPNPESIAENLLKALDAKQDREALRARVLERFDINTLADRYIEMYQSLLKKED